MAPRARLHRPAPPPQVVSVRPWRKHGQVHVLVSFGLASLLSVPFEPKWLRKEEEVERAVGACKSLDIACPTAPYYGAKAVRSEANTGSGSNSSATRWSQGNESQKKCPQERGRGGSRAAAGGQRGSRKRPKRLRTPPRALYGAQHTEMHSVPLKIRFGAPWGVAIGAQMRREGHIRRLQ